MKCLLDSDLCSILLSLIVLISCFSFISPKVHRDLAKRYYALYKKGNNNNNNNIYSWI